MDLDLTDEQQMLRQAVREMVEATSSPEQLRELEDGPVGFSRELWSQLVQMDLVGLTLPTEHGGSGMGAIDNTLLYHELGRGLATTPHLTSAVFCGRLLAAHASAEQRAAWLPRIATGDAILTVGWYEPERSEGATGIIMRAVADGDALVLDGVKIRVPLASESTAIATLVRTGDGDEDLSIVLVPIDAAGVSCEQTEVAGSDAEFRVTYDGVRVPATAVIGAVDGGWAAWSDALDDLHLAVAAWAVGAAERALELTVAYAKEREQFGRAIGSFQGLAHPIADCATAIAGAEVMVQRAAWTRDRGDDLGPIAAMTKYFAADTFKTTTKWGQQVFGGVGFTLAIDIQLFFRRAKQLELTWMGPAALEEIVAAAELDAEVPFVYVDAGIPAPTA